MAKSARSWRVLLVLVVAFVLGACGARVDTLLVINDDGSGQREMVLTLDRSDFESYVDGSEDDLLAAVEAGLPEQLRIVDVESDDDHIRGTIILDFENPDDYKAKVNALLDPEESDMTLLAEQGLFLSGVELREDFTSIQLLGWLPDVLVDAELIDEDNAGDVFDSQPSSTIEYLGKEESTYQPFTLDDSEKSGFSTIALITTIESVDSIERIVRYELESDLYEANKAEYDAFFESVKPSGAKLEPAKSDSAQLKVWDLTLTGSSASEIAKATSQALDSGDVEFSIEQDTTSAEGEITLISRADCEVICAGGESEIFELIQFPASWDPIGATADTVENNTLDNRYSNDTFTFEQRVSVVSVDLETAIWSDDTFHTTMTVEVENGATVSAFGDHLTPADGVGEIKINEGRDTTQFVIDLGRHEQFDYASNLREYFGDASVYLGIDSEGFYSNSLIYQVKIEFSEVLGSLFPVEEITHSYHPQGSLKAADDDGSFSRADGTWMVASTLVKESKTSGWIITGIITALIAGAITLAFLFREKLLALWRSFLAKQAAARERSLALAEQHAAEQSAAPQPPHGGAPQPAATGYGQVAQAPSAIEGPSAAANAAELDLMFSWGVEAAEQR